MGLFSSIANMGKAVCPYCFNSFKKSEALWRCNSYQCKNTNIEQDEAYTKFYNLPVNQLQPHIIKMPKVKNGFALCDLCGGMTNVKICPHCHSNLPSTDENIIISIVGAPGAGKSYYVGTLLKQVQSKFPTLKCTMRLDGQNRKLYDTKFKNYFESNKILEKTKQTNPGENIISNNMPILCTVTNSKQKARTFTFFDAAGENFDDEAIMRDVAPYIANSSAIILLLDPTDIPMVRNAICDEKGKAAVEENVISYEDLLNNLINVIKLAHASNAQIEIPLAICFSKWDLIENSPSLRPEGSVTLTPSPHFVQGFSESDCENISSDVEGLLNAWDQSNFILQARAAFKTVKFFVCSAIGAEAEMGKVPNIVSKRVEDPFLWLLNKNKLI